MKKLTLVIFLLSMSSLNAFRIKNELSEPLRVTIGSDPVAKIIEPNDEADFSLVPDSVMVYIITKKTDLIPQLPMGRGFESEIIGDDFHVWGTMHPDDSLTVGHVKSVGEYLTWDIVRVLGLTN